MLKTKMSKLMKKSSSPSKLSSRSIGTNSTSGNSDHHLSDAATVPPPTIADLIGNREWHFLEGLLMSGAPLCIDDEDLAEHAITDKIVVHFAVRFQAP